MPVYPGVPSASFASFAVNHVLVVAQLRRASVPPWLKFCFPIFPLLTLLLCVEKGLVVGVGFALANLSRLPRFTVGLAVDC